MDIEQVFAAVLEFCKAALVQTSYDVFFRGLTLLSLKENTALICAESRFQRDMVRERYSALLKQAFDHVLGFTPELSIIAEDEAEKAAPVVANSGEKQYTFESFIVGPNNRLAYAAAQAVAARPATDKNPLFIYGASGLGKTHLLMAIKNALVENFPGFKIVYTSSEAFTNRIVEAIQYSTTASFHEEFRSIDALLIDDVQFLASKVQTQVELFHTFDALYNTGKQIVLTSDRPPREIQTLEERLRSRFESGLTVDVSAPDFETKLAILKSKALTLGFELPDEVAKYVATHIKSNIRQLEGAVTKINAYRTLEFTTPSIAVAQEAIKDVVSENQPISVTVSKIIDEVARTYNLSSDELRSSKQDSAISYARQIAMYAIREATNMTMQNIGDEFGRDYSTVVYSLKKTEKLISDSPNLRLTIDDIIRNSKA